MLNVAVKAARAAGSLINRASLDLDLLKVSTKSSNDFVTEVDQKAEEVIIETLLGAYPGHGILAEESGRTHGAADSEYVWIIDPLDGTTNFIHGFPYYAVSIALAYRDQVQQAVVYDPTRNDLFYASKGRGAFLNDKRIRLETHTHVRIADRDGVPVPQGRQRQTLPEDVRGRHGKLRWRPPPWRRRARPVLRRCRQLRRLLRDGLEPLGHRRGLPDGHRGRWPDRQLHG